MNITPDLCGYVLSMKKSTVCELGLDPAWFSPVNIGEIKPLGKDYVAYYNPAFRMGIDPYYS